MKHVILHYFLIVYLSSIKLCTSSKRHRSRSGHYDINDFISQLLASSKFDELAEKLAEKAANRIMHLQEDQAPIDRENSLAQFEEKYINDQKRKGFTGKIDPLAVMNESITLSENLMLKYKSFKKNVLDENIKKQKETLHINGTNEEYKGNKSIELELEGVKKVDQNKNIRSDQKDSDQKVEPKRNIEPNNSHNGKDGYQPQEGSPRQEESNLPEEQNLGAEVKEQEAIQVDNGIKEDIASSLDEQNQNYSPSGEKDNAGAEVERTEDEPQKRATDESAEIGREPYFRAQEDSVKENMVPSKSDKPNLDGGSVRNIGANDTGAAGDRGSIEKGQNSAEKAKEDSANPDIRREGEKVYTYNQGPEYQEYHEEMAKWRQGHPYNPADFM